MIHQNNIKNYYLNSMDKADKNKFWLYNKGLRNFAHENRSDATKAEACLWKFVLKTGLMRGYTFNRQRPVLNYIADFMCKELMLIIEVDGITHFTENAELHDEIRQKNLENAGFLVIRFTDEEVLTSISLVRDVIEQHVNEREKILGASPRQRKRRK